MPQEICLVKEFTVIGALYYFGRISGLKDEEIEERYEHLAELLQLPPKNRLLKNSSGGQQRRVSFAAALLHRPELLVLDEPTVGLDPVLRDNIWKFLLKIVKDQGVTIVITTHYIEEAKESDKVGLMRCGKLIAEATPRQLLARFQCQNLEDVFLTLSRHQQENVNGMDRSGIYCPEPPEVLDAVPSVRETNSPMKFRNVRSSASRRFKALIIKNVTQFLRHPGGILFAIVLPLIQSFIFYNAYGGEPRDLMVGIVNLEAGDCHRYENRGVVHYNEENFTCEFIDLSCRYLREIDDYSIKKVYYDYLPDAKNDVRKGHILGIIYFGKNFSTALQRRLEDMRFVEEENIVMGEIQVWLDMSDRQLSLHLRKKLYEAYFDSFKNVTAECHIPEKFVEIPIRFEDPIYGTNKEEYRAYATPPFILTAIFFLAASVTSAIIITDKHEGVWDRSLVQGVKTPEILFAHFLIQLVVIIVQIVIIYCVFLVHFRLVCNGSIFASLVISFLIGMCGMFYGFLVSMVSSSHTMANYTVTGTFYPVILLCGFLWPVEGMPQFLRWVSYVLPTTLPGISLRAIMVKGHPVANPEVYKGFIAVVGWTVVLILLCLYRLKAKSS